MQKGQLEAAVSAVAFVAVGKHFFAAQQLSYAIFPLNLAPSTTERLSNSWIIPSVEI
jgi:hypothetical protein